MRECAEGPPPWRRASAPPAVTHAEDGKEGCRERGSLVRRIRKIPQVGNQGWKTETTARGCHPTATRSAGAPAAAPAAPAAAPRAAAVGDGRPRGARARARHARRRPRGPGPVSAPPPRVGAVRGALG